MVDRLKGRIKSLPTDQQGKSKGFGFIKIEDGSEFFFHRTACGGGLRFHSLREGDAVVFTSEESDKGPRAVDVDLDA